MTFPDVIVETGTVAPPRSVPTDTGVAFLAGLFDRGPAGVLQTPKDGFTSQAAVEAVYGKRQSYGVASDWVEAFFRRGGNRLYISRVVGPAAAAASLALTGTGTTLTYRAPSKGGWANAGGLTVEIANGPAGSSTRVLIVRIAGVEVYRTDEQTTRDLMVSALPTAYGTLEVGGGSGLPNVSAAANVTGGTDDRGSITQTQVTAALGMFPKGLGRGQILSPDWNTSAAHLALGALATATNRWAVCDPVDTTNVATVMAAEAAIRGSADADRLFLIWPWETIPGSASGSSGRSVPGSSHYAPGCARVDASHGPNQAPAGDLGITDFVVDVKATPTEAEKDQLNAAGVNVIINDNGDITLMGNRTQVIPAPQGQPQSPLLWASNGRYRMGLQGRIEQTAKPYVQKRITRHGLDNLKTDLVALLNGDYGNGDLYGDPDDDRPETAFHVDMTGNTAATAAAGQIVIKIAYRPAPGAELVFITIIATAATQPVA